MKRLLPILLAAFLIAGCSHHYKIVDNNSNRTYYTKSVWSRNSGAVSFTDANTGNKVTLFEHEQSKISKEEFESNVKAKSAK